MTTSATPNEDAGPNDEERGQPQVPAPISLARSSSLVSFALGQICAMIYPTPSHLRDFAAVDNKLSDDHELHVAVLCPCGSDVHSLLYVAELVGRDSTPLLRVKQIGDASFLRIGAQCVSCSSQHLLFDDDFHGWNGFLCPGGGARERARPKYEMLRLFVRLSGFTFVGEGRRTMKLHNKLTGANAGKPFRFGLGVRVCHGRFSGVAQLRRWASRKKRMRIAIILAMCCSFFAGCRTSDSSSRVPATPESVAKRVEQLNLQHERIEELAVRRPHRSSEVLRAVHTGRAAWSDYLRAEQELRANFAASGIVLDAEYYRLQEQLLEAFSRQWQQIEDLLATTP